MSSVAFHPNAFTVLPQADVAAMALPPFCLPSFSRQWARFLVIAHATMATALCRFAVRRMPRNGGYPMDNLKNII